MLYLLGIIAIFLYLDEAENPLTERDVILNLCAALLWPVFVIATAYNCRNRLNAAFHLLTGYYISELFRMAVDRIKSTQLTDFGS